MTSATVTEAELHYTTGAMSQTELALGREWVLEQMDKAIMTCIRCTAGQRQMRGDWSC